MLAGVVLPPVGLAGLGAVSAYQAWTAGNLVWDHRGQLVRYARQGAEAMARVDRRLDGLRTRAHLRLVETFENLRGPRTGPVAPSGARPRPDVADVLGPVLRRRPDAEWLRERWRQVGEPLRLPLVPLPPGLPWVDLGTWRRLPGIP